jgi:hypothetical protein
MIAAPVVLLARGMYQIIPKLDLFKHNKPFDQQLVSNKIDGGYFTGSNHKKISTRENFYTFLGLRAGGENVSVEYIILLSNHMSASNQIPAYFTENIWGDKCPYYKVNGYEIVDSNAIFLILLEWLSESHSQTAKAIFLIAQRAMQYLENFIKDDVFFEPDFSSWENTRLPTKNSGLTTSVLVCRAFRSLEMLAMKNGNHSIQKKCVEKHTRFLKKLRVKLYQTQETIPRMLAVFFNMMPSNFWRSFDQEFKLDLIPLIIHGPIDFPCTWESWLYGIGDQHTTILYPWIAYFWIGILGRKGKVEMAKEYFNELQDLHLEPTFYSIYDPETYQPVRRAFLSAEPTHSITLAMYSVARDICEDRDICEENKSNNIAVAV